MQKSQKDNVEQNSTCPICNVAVPKANFNIHKTRCTAKAYRRKKYAEKKAKEKESKKQQTKRSGKSQEPQKQQKKQEQELFPCHLCDYKQTMAQLDTHFKNCRNRQITCPFCENNFPNNLMIQHREVCQVRLARQRPAIPPPIRRQLQNASIQGLSRRLSSRNVRAQEASSPRNQSSGQGQANNSSNQRSQGADQTHVAQNLRQPLPRRVNNRGRTNSSGIFSSHRILPPRSNSRQFDIISHIAPPNSEEQYDQSSRQQSSNPPTRSQSIQTGPLPLTVNLVARNFRNNNPFLQMYQAQPHWRRPRERGIHPLIGQQAQFHRFAGSVSAQHFRRLHQMLQDQIRIAAQRFDELNLGGLTEAQINKIPNKLYQEKNQEEKETCCICYCDFQITDQVKDLKCKHLFHVNCIKQWLKKNKLCPLCKENTTLSIKQPEKEKKTQNNLQKPETQASQMQVSRESRSVEASSAQRGQSSWRQRWFDEQNQEQQYINLQSLGMRLRYYDDEDAE